MLHTRHLKARPQRIVAFGSSLTAEWNWRVWRHCGGHWVRLLRADLRALYGERASVANLARWGADSAWAASRIVELAGSQAADVAFVEFAINDSDVRRNISLVQSRQNMAYVIKVMRATWHACDIHLLVTNPVFGRHQTSRPRLREYYQSVRELAGEQQVGLIDLAPAWQQALARRDWCELLPDGIHPGVEAAREIILPQVRRALNL